MHLEEEADDSEMLWDMEKAFDKAKKTNGVFRWYRPYLLAGNYKHIIDGRDMLSRGE